MWWRSAYAHMENPPHRSLQVYCANSEMSNSIVAYRQAGDNHTKSYVYDEYMGMQQTARTVHAIRWRNAA